MTNDNWVINAHDTIEIYMRNCKKNGYTWYSTNSLKSGMNDEKVKKYNELAKAGLLKIYYAMNEDDIDNDIAYVACVDEIVSFSQPTKAPCKEYEYPEEWRGCKNNIWIKVHDLREENEVTADDFIVVSTGNILKEVIKKGQYIFGYIRRK